jgi:hypothetical protein
VQTPPLLKLRRSIRPTSVRSSAVLRAGGDDYSRGAIYGRADDDFKAFSITIIDPVTL